MKDNINNKSKQIDPICLRVKELREKLDLTQKEFSHQLDVSPSNISSIEIGYRVPGIKAIKKIAKTFNANLDFLTKGSGEIFNKKALEEKDINNEIEKLYNEHHDQKNIQDPIVELVRLLDRTMQKKDEQINRIIVLLENHFN